jgi:hypothetical protein
VPLCPDVSPQKQFMAALAEGRKSDTTGMGLGGLGTVGNVARGIRNWLLHPHVVDPDTMVLRVQSHYPGCSEYAAQLLVSLWLVGPDETEFPTGEDARRAVAAELPIMKDLLFPEEARTR